MVRLSGSIVAEAAIAAAMISPCTSRLWTRASISAARQARKALSYKEMQRALQQPACSARPRRRRALVGPLCFDIGLEAIWGSFEHVQSAGLAPTRPGSECHLAGASDPKLFVTPCLSTQPCCGVTFP